MSNHGLTLGLLPDGDVVGLGLAGGTSTDGIDAALVRFPAADGAPPSPELLAWQTMPLQAEQREWLAALADADPGTLAAADLVLGRLFAAAGSILMADTPSPAPSFVGCGGQTIAHLGTGGTLQLGAGAELVESLNLPTVAGFRITDVAAGGEGAPLAPFLDWVLFRDTPGTVALNLGGIANLTWVAGDLAEVIAFDSGPANSLIDRCAAWASSGALACDEGGELAAAGRVDEALLAELLDHSFYTEPPPRSTGTETFGDDCFAGILAHHADVAPADLASTLTELTVRTIADAVAMLPGTPTRIVASGGGCHNPVLIGRLASRLAPVPLAPIERPGWTDAKEAVLFALLAHETLRGRPSNVPGATGAMGHRVLGAIHLPHREDPR